MLLISNFFIVLPVPLLVIYCFISGLLEDINGEYERLVKTYENNAILGFNKIIFAINNLLKNY